MECLGIKFYFRKLFFCLSCQHLVHLRLLGTLKCSVLQMNSKFFNTVNLFMSGFVFLCRLKPLYLFIVGNVDQLMKIRMHLDPNLWPFWVWSLILVSRVALWLSRVENFDLSSDNLALMSCSLALNGRDIVLKSYNLALKCGNMAFKSVNVAHEWQHVYLRVELVSQDWICSPVWQLICIHWIARREDTLQLGTVKEV